MELVKLYWTNANQNHIYLKSFSILGYQYQNFIKIHPVVSEIKVSLDGLMNFGQTTNKNQHDHVSQFMVMIHVMSHLQGQGKYNGMSLLVTLLPLSLTNPEPVVFRTLPGAEHMKR
jgi:hypothetical protein